MRRTILFFTAALMFSACKKDGASGAKMFLSKVFSNNLLAQEYIYSNDKKPVRRNIYTTQAGTSTFAGFYLYEYSGNLLTTVLSFNKNNQFSSKQVLTYNASNRPSRLDFYGNDDDIDYYHLFEYDNNQQLAKITNHSIALSKKVGEIFLQYNAQNNLTSIRRYYLSGTNWIFNDSAIIAHNNKSLPGHWEYFEMLPVHFPGENGFLQMTAETVFYYMAGGPPTKNNQYYTDKVYNGQGYLVSQHYRIDVDNAINITSYDFDLRYEYIE